MTKMTRTKAAVAGVLTAALLVGAGVGAHAQNRAQTAGRPAVQRNIDPAAIRARMDERHAARAAALHDLLAITPAQEDAWAAYQSAVRPPVRDGGRRGPGARQDLQGLTTPQRMDRLVQEANERHAEVLGRAAAIRQFYGQLSPTQKKAFDALPQVGPRGGDHGGRMGPGPRGGRGGFGEGRGPRGPRPEAPAN
jgi:hypothetical protein